MTDYGSGRHSSGKRPSPHEVISFFTERREPAPRLRVALVGTYAPRGCGIATFTTDVREKLAQYYPDMDVDVYALDAADSCLSYAKDIHRIDADDRAEYVRAARAINESAADVVWVQHEFGIFGGVDGAYIADLVDAVAAPVIITFHTVLANPSAGQRAMMDHLISRASRIMVMSHEGCKLLTSTYRAKEAIIEIIEHGAPDRPFGNGQSARVERGLDGRRVLTTFGLLGPGKGLETAIAALPAILERHPDTVYRILGATHPVLAARDGESYREGLIAQAEALGVSHAIQWENRFLDIEELLENLECCDIYLTPYPGMAQSTSGTLSYAVALGKAVVSTPYVHARELLADGVGRLIEPHSPAAIARAVNELLDDPRQLLETQKRAYQRGRRTIWPHFARASAHLIRNTAAPRPRDVSPAMVPGLSAVWAMSDATGMLQHSIGIIPDRRHGYCLDDNARALMLMNVATGLSESERLRWSATYASFVQFAWNPDQRRFRNFMRFDRGWCEDAGSPDSNGRALWALGHTVERSPLRDMSLWASGLFTEVVDALEDLNSPRTMAFATLGACAMLRAGADLPAASALIERACDTFLHLLDRHRRPAWVWFEAVLGYDNPRLPQALIEGAMVTGREDWLRVGLETLAWIGQCQTSQRGHFRPIGSESFGKPGDWKPFDQQPLEAQAAIEAAEAAWKATGDRRWVNQAHQAYQWFFGANDRGVVLADLATGRCRDGVTPRGRNENSGAESILAFQLSHYTLAAMLRAERPMQNAGNDLGPTSGQSRPQPAAHS